MVEGTLLVLPEDDDHPVGGAARSRAGRRLRRDGDTKVCREPLGSRSVRSAAPIDDLCHRSGRDPAQVLGRPAQLSEDGSPPRGGPIAGATAILAAHVWVLTEGVRWGAD